MMNDNATTWRELTDQLTPEQVEAMNRAEGVEGMTAEMLLALAREYVESNVAQAFYGGLPEPAAERVYEWQPDDGDGYLRHFTVTSRRVDSLSFDVGGIQYSDGRIEHHIVTDSGEHLTAEQARALAAVLLASADQLDGLAAQR